MARCSTHSWQARQALVGVAAAVAAAMVTAVGTMRTDKAG